MERAEKEADDADKSDSESSSDSSDSSSKSSFGHASEKGSPDRKKPALPKRKSTGASSTAKAKAKTKTPPGSAKKAGAEVEKFESAHDAAKKYLATIQELRADTLWKSCVRAHEVDRRLGRESAVVSHLESTMSSQEIDAAAIADAKTTVSKIKEQNQFVMSMKEVCIWLRSAKPSCLVLEVTEAGGTLSKLLAANDFVVGKRMAEDSATLREILLFVAKKLVDVPWHA